MDSGEYSRLNVLVETDKEVIRAISYVVAKPLEKEICPTKDYANLILAGAEEHNLPKDYQAKLRAQINSLRPRATNAK